MISPTRRNDAALVLGLTLTAFAAPSEAVECSGTDISELRSGCNVLVDNEDFALRLYAPCGSDLESPQGVADALDRVLVFVHGYSVVDTVPPRIRRQDGTTQALEDALAGTGISVLAMAPGDSKTDRVEDDAAALEAALRLVEGYRNEAAPPLAVFGHSMGGLLARIALSKMEASGGHDVGLYVSYDSPHRGVNVPQGMQNMKVKLDEWAAMTEEDFIAIDSGWAGVFRAADMLGITTALDPDSIGGVPDPVTIQAQQMTIRSVKGPEEHTAFMTLLDEVGFPEVRKIAISNGNTQGVGNTQAVEPGGELFFFEGGKGNSIASVEASFEVFTDLPGATCFKSHVFYDGFTDDHDGGEKNATSPADLVVLDHLSGGTLDYAAEMYEAAHASRRDFHRPSYRAASDSAIPFVPTSSAFALDVATPDGDLAGIVAAADTPFDDVFAIGDLPAFSSNIDHNTIVVPDALFDEIKALMPGYEPPGPDLDGDGVIDVCDDDVDGDGAPNHFDNCPEVPNPDQADMNNNRIGDACDDEDGDGVVDAEDNCPWEYNPDQADTSGNGIGDLCDPEWLYPEVPPGDENGPVGCAGCSAAPGMGLIGLLVALGLRVRRR